MLSCAAITPSGRQTRRISCNAVRDRRRVAAPGARRPRRTTRRDARGRRRHRLRTPRCVHRRVAPAPAVSAMTSATRRCRVRQRATVSRATSSVMVPGPQPTSSTDVPGTSLDASTRRNCRRCASDVIAARCLRGLGVRLAVRHDGTLRRQSSSAMTASPIVAKMPLPNFVLTGLASGSRPLRARQRPGSSTVSPNTTIVTVLDVSPGANVTVPDAIWKSTPGWGCVVSAVVQSTRHRLARRCRQRDGDCERGRSGVALDHRGSAGHHRRRRVVVDDQRESRAPRIPRRGCRSWATRT